MALQNSNTTCDIYRQGNSPPAAPDVAAVRIWLTADYQSGHEAAIASGSIGRWTHVALMAPTTDIRDSYAPNGPSQEAWSSGLDTVYIPDKNGQPYWVIFVQRDGRGTQGDVKRVFLQRQGGAWPTNNL